MTPRPEAGRLQLWVLSYNFRPRWAGPAERFLRYAPGLRARGVELTVVTTALDGLGRGDELEGTAVVRVGMAGDGTDRFETRALLLALRSRPRPDVVLFLAASPWHAPLIRALGALGVGTIYVSTMARQPPSGRSRPRMWARRQALRWLHRSFHRNVSSTSALAADFSQVGVPPGEQEIVPNGVSLRRFRPCADPGEVADQRALLGLPPDEPVVLYVGLVAERKGVVELVQAWQRHRRGGGLGRLVVVGAEQREIGALADFYRRWDACVASLESSDAVELRPASERVEEYYRAADLFVLLSDTEGMPNVLLEAMACGLPVLTTRFRGFSAEFGRDGEELEVTTRSPEDLARRIGALLGDAGRRHRLGRNARAWVERRHSVDSSLDRYAALCRAVKAEATAGAVLGAQREAWR